MTGNGNDSWLLALAIAALATLAGYATAVVAGRAGFKAVYYAAVFGMLGLCALVALTRDEPLRLGWLALFAGLPYANAQVPPGRYGLTMFDAVMIPLALILVVQRLLAGSAGRRPLFPGRSLLIAWLLSLPCLALSLFPAVSFKVFAVNMGAYAFFLMALAELEREGGFRRIVALLSVVLIVLSLGLFADHLYGINLSPRGTNLNQLSMASGLQLRRASGFFQDPQIAAAFAACATTFLLLLLVRGRFAGSRLRLPVALAVLCGFTGIVTTISRGAILACVGVSLFAIFLFNRWSAPLKVLSVGMFLVLAGVLAATPSDALLDLLPRAVALRFAELGESLDHRLMIWFDTWDMFADYPLTGIGMGAFQPYLLETRPGVVNYYGIGVAAGVPYVPDQPENGYLKVLYEGGIFGALAMLVFAGAALGRAAAVIRRSGKESFARTEAIAALGGMLTFAITFVTLFTWTDARMSALFLLLVAVVWSRSLALERSPGEAPR